MYAKQSVRVTYFADNTFPHTEKVFYGRITEAINTGEKDENGRVKYIYEGWPVRFVGAARKKAESLKDRDRITLLEWSARNNYSKEKKVNYPYLLVMDFEITEKHEKKKDEE